MQRLCKSFSNHVICYFGVSIFAVIASQALTFYKSRCRKQKRGDRGVLRRLFQKAARFCTAERNRLDLKTHKEMKCTQYESCLLTLLTLKIIYISDRLLLVPRVAWQLLASSLIWFWQLCTHSQNCCDLCLNCVSGKFISNHGWSAGDF